MIEISHHAMACDFVVVLRDPDQRMESRAVADVVVDALEKVDAIEDRLSVYRTASEISRVNLAAATSPVAISIPTQQLLVRANELSAATGGAFDVTAGPLIQTWGFTRRNGRKPSMEELAHARQRVGFHKLQLKDQRVSFDQAGMQLNLGAIGKGEAIDQVANELINLGIHDFLLHAGQSSVLARGNQFDDDANDTETPPRKGWMVGIAHPTKPNHRLAGIWLQDCALATSGSGKQFFHHHGKRYGHVIDPRSGQPAGDLLSLSLLTESAVDADALATALFVMGRDEAKQFAGENSLDLELPLLMVAAGSRQDSVDVNTTGKWHWVDPPQTATENSPEG